MKQQYYLLFFLFPIAAYSQELPFPPSQEPPIKKLTPLKEIVKEQQDSIPTDSKSSRILCKNLQAILLVNSSYQEEYKDFLKIDGVWFKEISAPGGNGKLAARLQGFLQRPLTEANVYEIKREIAYYYREHNYPLVKIIAPKQSLTRGVLQLLILEAHLGKIVVKGNEHVSCCAIEKSIRLTPGETINELCLIRDISWINSNPFRQVHIAYRPGEKDGTTDVNLIVSDQKPSRVYVGADNTGTPQIGKTRLFTGINVSDAFFTNHMFSFQFTTCSDLHKFTSYTFQYAAPLPWRNTLSFFGAYATVHPTASALQSHGKTYQTSARYTIPQWFSRYSWVDQNSYEIGFDFKGTNNNIIFGSDNAIPVLQQLAWIGQFTGSFYTNFNRHGLNLAAGIEAYWSPGQMLSHQTPEDYGNLRQGATAKYFYSRLSLILDQKLPYWWSLYFQGRVQLSTKNLLASEQFALGGYATVRGYNERVVNGDNALCGNLEFRTPAFQLLTKGFSKVKDSLQFLLFADGGYGWDHEKIPGLPLAQTLIGVGPGIRYRIFPYLISRFDVGFPLHSVVGENHTLRVHFSASLNY